MPRIARVVGVTYPHHITQRGNYRQIVFTGEEDYRFYLERLNEYCRKYKLLMLAYCLMPNHVHFVSVPEEGYSLARTLNDCHMRYAHYFNRKNHQTGHLWQGRFYSCILDERHLYAAVRYVENNPIRAGLVKKAWQWNWSSAKTHMKEADSILALDDINKYFEIDDWEDYLSRKEDGETIKAIRGNTLTGRPLGSDTFIMNLEKSFGRRLKALPKGRPRNK